MLAAAILGAPVGAADRRLVVVPRHQLQRSGPAVGAIPDAFRGRVEHRLAESTSASPRWLPETKERPPAPSWFRQWGSNGCLFLIGDVEELLSCTTCERSCTPQPVCCHSRAQSCQQLVLAVTHHGGDPAIHSRCQTLVQVRWLAEADEHPVLDKQADATPPPRRRWTAAGSLLNGDFPVALTGRHRCRDRQGGGRTRASAFRHGSTGDPVCRHDGPPALKIPARATPREHQDNRPDHPQTHALVFVIPKGSPHITNPP